MTFSYGTIGGFNSTILARLKASKVMRPLTVLDVGASANPWTAEVLDAALDLNDSTLPNIVHFVGNINDVSAWDQVRRYVDVHGKFSYSICCHTLEDLAYPMVAMNMLPLVSEAGFISMPSFLRELTRRIEGGDSNWRGYIHHKWIFRVIDNELMLIPKMPFVEHLQYVQDCPGDEFTELRIQWEKELPYKVFNNGYLGPNAGHIVQIYSDILKGGI